MQSIQHALTPSSLVFAPTPRSLMPLVPLMQWVHLVGSTQLLRALCAAGLLGSTLAAHAQGPQPGQTAQTAQSVKSEKSAQTTQTTPKAERALETVVITASGYEQAVEDAPASITVIPRAELEKKAYRDVTDALKDVPGVVITGGGSNSDISIRGMAAAYTLLLVDGRRQNSRETRPNSDTPGVEQGWLPPIDAIERIEVIRGPMSSLYGSDAMGGVVNIITRKVPKKWTGNIRTETTQQESSLSGDIYQSDFYLAGPIKDDLLGLQLFGQTARRQEDRIINGFNEQRTTAGTAKLSLTPNRDHDFIFEVGRSLQERNSTTGKSASRSGEDTQYDRTHVAATHIGRWSFGTSNTHVQHEEINNPSREMYLKNIEFNSQLTMDLSARNVTTMGVSYKNEELVDKGNRLRSKNPIEKLQRYQWALFAENEWRMLDAFALTTGLRMNHDENYGTDWTPRVYGIWKSTDQLSVKGGISTGFKTPALRSAVADWGQITGGGGDPAIIRGNPDLKPEKSISQELGVIWDNHQNFSSSLTLFNTEFKDKITEVRACTDTAGRGQKIVTGNCTIYGTPYKFISDRVNVDKANMRGVEATGTWSINSDLRIATNYTFTRSKQKSGPFAGQPLTKMPKHMLNATLDWKATPKLGTWGRVNLRSRTSDSLSRVSMQAGTPSFTFVDVGLNYAFSKDVKLGAGVYNLLDKQVDYSGFRAAYDGRRYWASMTVGF